MEREQEALSMGGSMTQQEALAEFHRFNSSFNSAILATVNGEGFADASYAPILSYQGNYYVFVSELANHTQNLFNHHRLTVMFIEPETVANLFRRKRSMIQCNAQFIDRDDMRWHDILNEFERVLGKMMRQLRDFSDFCLFEVVPEQATYVRGFAQAYRLSESELKPYESND